ncbi:lytic transglycosylase domain-containing protein [Conexibacter stalactiti]|uniref:Lytic transglycosylase domain-containing protein n=1 Tax=Conexibacter stalactiti TaxID=1940611 RepID=A0ABU4HWY4_9ACTN|nr:lytic transglycosylase domain-containing protein [Conexibacter stalactiti]MDW5597005.1 lytic transglycosylase domain-containing protein [Conexibacter stalactiti]MEC5037647.1 lytic transglycosylase domain-containing protein [Conexibacter stalactiti]
MSVPAVDAIAAVGTGAQNAVARIAELQQLVARAHALPQAQSAAGSATPNFASVLAGSSAGLGGAIATAPAPFGVTPPASTVPVATGTGALGGEPSAFDGLIVAAAQRHGLDPALLKGLIRAESNFDPNASSPAGAAGLVQLMPGTAASLGVADRLDPAQSIEGGAKYLRQQLDAFGGDVTKALAAYNAGPGAVTRYGGVPPYAETQAYVVKVQAYADEYRVAAPAVATVPAVAPTTAPVFSTAIPTTGSGSIT